METRPGSSNVTVSSGLSSNSRQPSNISVTQTKTPETVYARPISLNEIEIGRSESNVIISTESWDTAKVKNSYTSMACSLLLAVYDLRTLLQSNVNGGKCKVTKKKKPEQHKTLDANLLRAIKYTVREKFPNQYKEAALNTAITNKLNALRTKNRVQINRENNTRSEESD
ncbi:Protein of unknown function [Cotesia congregata]|uniref:BEN domain-containing protein n=1 Tax=Cotesia congregata TaxID=51543 RepID=A0A8J2E4I5_COTCN|nr:Protein of unknown function [Cotesia congregata]